MSVRDLVEAAKKDHEAAWIKKEEAKIKAKKDKELKDFIKAVDILMGSFESYVFNLKSTEEQVAKRVLNEDGIYLLIDKKYVWKIWHEDDTKELTLRTYKKYQEWEKALEDKFNVNIYIDTEYAHTPRYSNHGYLVGYDDHYQGVKAYVSLKDE